MDDAESALEVATPNESELEERRYGPCWRTRLKAAAESTPEGAAVALASLPSELVAHLESPELTFASLMAGVGGRSSAYRLDDARWQGVAVEMHKPFVAVHAHNAPDIPVHRHYMRRDDPLPAIILNDRRPLTHLSAGPPCQPYSRAGKGEGADDQRDGIPAVIAAALRLRPLVVEVENVPEVQKHPQVVGTLRSQLERAGYWVEEAVLNAADYGVPQRRRRYFMVASLLGPIPWPPPTTRGAPVTVEQAIGSSTKFNAFNSYYPKLELTAKQRERAEKLDILSRCVNFRELHPHLPARTLTSSNLGNKHALMLRLRLSDGHTLRLPTLGEASRLQTLPEDFVFPAELISERQAYLAIGNAMPTELARQLTQAARWAIGRRVGTTSGAAKSPH